MAENVTIAPAICEPGGSGLLLPLTDAEQSADKGARAVIYILFLLYMFMGVGTVADCFMNAVEKIISQKKRRKIVSSSGKERFQTYLVWNSTVADLTLLALGSSAPEILLSILEIVGAGFYSGDLGPSTIVGSAAFNLLIILAVCIVAIPAGQTRAIEHMSVYHVTVLFGIFAYLWLMLIVQVISPNVVEIWEACVTFLMFPLLVTISWLANKGKLEFMSLERRSEEETGLLAAAYAPDEVPQANMRKSQHPRLHNNAATSNRRSSQMSLSNTNTEVAGQDVGRGEEDQPIPAGSMNGREILGLNSPEPLDAPHGVLTFRSDAVDVNTPETNCKEQDGYTLVVDVLRCNGCEGKVTCKVQTEGLSAVPGKDFDHVEDVLEFDEGVKSKQVRVKIHQQREDEPDDVLQLVLSEVEGDAIFNPHDDGGREMAMLTITIRNSESPTLVERIIDKDNFEFGLQEWMEQIKGSIRIDEEGDGEEAPKLGPSDYFFFVLGLPFKVFFGLTCPPPCWAGGLLLFVVSLGWVAVVTALISDLASLFGCCAGLPDATTAITIVAMGTSLPDTFASMASAAKDDTADSSIVNVTGSNSVNVYLGIGIPWLAAALYWASPGETLLAEWKVRYSDIPDTLAKYPNGAFVVKAGALGFSVLLFNCVGIVCLVVLRVRRLALGGELGGPKTPAWACSITLFTLWSIYIASSIWRNEADSAEVMVYPAAVLAVLAIIGGVGYELSGKYRFDPAKAEDEKQKKMDLAARDTEEENRDFHVLNVEDQPSKIKSMETNDIKEGLEPAKIGASAEEEVEPNAQEAPVDVSPQTVGEDAVLETAPPPSAAVAPSPAPVEPALALEPAAPGQQPESPGAEVPETPATPATPPTAEAAEATPKEEGGEKKKKGPKKSEVKKAPKKLTKDGKADSKEPKKPDPSPEAPEPTA